MIGVLDDFENLILTSFPTTFEALEMITSELLSPFDTVDLVIVDFV